MDKGRFTPSVAKKLLRMLAGETVPSSSLPRWLAGELEGEGLLIPVTHGSRVSYRLTNVDVCRKFICDTYTSGTSLERWLEVADGEHGTQYACAGNRKFQVHQVENLLRIPCEQLRTY